MQRPVAVPAEEHADRQAGKDESALPEYDVVCGVAEAGLDDSLGSVCCFAGALEAILDVPVFCGRGDENAE